VPHRRTAFRTCPLCEATCGLEITLDGDEVVRIRGDRADVFSKGFICPKGSTLKQLQEDPDRLRAPEVKRDGSHRTVSWDGAFAEVEDRLLPIIERHGRDAVGIYLGNPNVHTMSGALYTRPLLKTLGTRSIFTASTVDQMPKHVSSGFMFGRPGTIAVPDIDRTGYLLMLGADPWESNGSLATAPDFPGRLEALLERGGKLVVVDPRRSKTAHHASEHIFIRPGSDALFLFAVVNELFARGVASDSDLFAGRDDVQRLATPFTAEAVADRTGIDAAVTRRIVAELAAAPTAVVYGRMGTHTARFGTLAAWLVDVINALTGNLDRPGGAMFPYPATGRRRSGPGGRGFVMGRWRSRVADMPEVLGELPVVTLAEEILTPGDGQIRALITVAGNPALSTPDNDRLNEALASLEFMVSVDPYRNETTRHADVILPPPPPLERPHYDFAFYGLSVRNVANYSPAVIDGGAVPEWHIIARLTAIASGFGAATPAEGVDDYLIGAAVEREVGRASSPIAGRDAADILEALRPETGPERFLDFLLRVGPYGEGFGSDPDGLTLANLRRHPHGIDLGPLRPAFPEVIATESGRVELAPPQITADVPRLAAFLDEPTNGDLSLIGRRHVRSNNTWMHNIEVLVKGKERCTLWVNPADAERLGLADGAAAEVSSPSGSVVAPVEVTDDVMAGVVSLPHGWGHGLEGTAMEVAAEYPGVSANVLTGTTEVDAVSGNAVLNGVAVRVRAAVEVGR
jgi:anaerobic selenocysteine-containing dehydrogenase